MAEAAHAPAFLRSQDFEIAAVADASPKRLQAAQALFPGARAYADAQSLYAAEKLDFVDIATPPHLHYAQCLEALGRRLHVLCEKPLVFSAREFEALKAESLSRKRALFPVHNWKYAPPLMKMHELLRSGAVGELRHLELHVLRRKPAAVAGKGGGNWRTDRAKAGGGILVDHGWHNLYLLSWLMGSAPAGMDAVLHPPHGAADEEATCLLRFAKPPATALMHLSWRAPLRAQWGLAYGRSGSLELQDDRLVLRRGEEPPRTFQFAQKLSAGSSHPEWFAAMLPDFRAALASPAEPSPTLAEAGICAELIERAYRPQPAEALRR